MLALLRRKPKLKRISGFMTFNFAGLTVFSLIMMVPIVFTLNHAFKPITELFLFPPNYFVRHPTLANFKTLFLSDSAIPFSRYLANSVMMSAATVFAVILVSSMAAYAFSKRSFPGSKLFFSFVIVALMFDNNQVIIPRFLIVAKLGIMDTYWVHFLPFLAYPVCVFLMKQFIDQIPDALMEAAKIDGAKEWYLFTKIVIPMCMPAVATIGIFAFQQIWPEVESSNLYTHVESQRLLNYFVLSLTNGSATTSAEAGSVNGVSGGGIAAAAALIVFLPFLVVFFTLQRKVLQTMANSGIK